jgi:hypothetical protein
VLLLAAGCDHETIQPQLPDVVEQLGELLPGATVAITGLDGYVASVRDAERRLEAGGAALERHRGELRGSLHAPILSSIFSARVSLKQDNDRVQALLEQHVEPLMATAVIAGVRPRRDVDPFLRHAWRLVLENHPHDSIGGCSIDEVHLEMPSRTMRAEATALGLVEDLRTALQLGDVAVVHDAVGRGGIAERRDGTPLEVVAGRPGMLVPLSDLQPGEREGRAEIEGDSGIRAGTLAARVVDGRLQVERDGSRTWLDYVDEADAGDEYDFGQVPGDEPIIATVTQVQACMASAGVAELDVLHELQLPIALAEGRAARSDELASTTIRTRVRLALTSELAQLVVELDNQVDDHRLRLRATVDALSATDRVTALGHFALIERPVRPAQPQQPWRQQPPGLDHCAGAVRAGEVLLAGRGIHEYEAGVGRLELTLLRAVGWLSRDDIAARPGHAGPALAAPGAQCRGPIRLDLAVGIGGDRDAAFDEARSFLVPPLLLEPFGVGESQQPRAVAGPVVPLESGSMARARDVLEDAPRDARARIDAIGIRLEGAGVVPSACKLADDGSGDLIARWWAPDNATGARAELHVAAAVRDVHRARLDETRLGPAPFERGVCSIGVQPGGISTLRVSFEE